MAAALHRRQPVARFELASSRLKVGNGDQDMVELHPASLLREQRVDRLGEDLGVAIDVRLGGRR